jgi:hypothetical protein
VYDRRGYGVSAKQKFYAEELKHAGGVAPKITALGEHPFAYHLGSISEADPTKVRRPVAGKIAVFYADGNGLSGLQNRLVGDAPDPVEQQQALDTKLKGYRRAFLHDLLSLLADNGAIGPPQAEEAAERHGPRDHDVVRMETLLWGGDEFLLVRLGFAIAQRFLDSVHDATAPWKLGSEQLEFACGLIFCHDDAPIAALRSLAGYGLGELAKEVDRKQSLIAPLVLESFDHVGRDLGSYYQYRLPTGIDKATCC